VLQQLQPQLVLDIGTYTGMSARVICDHSPACARIHSFDLLPWDSFASHLNPADFQGQRLQQHLENLADSAVFQRFFPLLDQADLIFCDAPKDGLFEPAFLALLAAAPLSNRPRWLLLDDIRFLQMVDCWRSIASPKLDLTSFGHWSGTGLVDISQGLQLQPWQAD
jgi:predicted O-methyltransferase YrrM